MAREDLSIVRNASIDASCSIHGMVIPKRKNVSVKMVCKLPPQDIHAANVKIT